MVCIYCNSKTAVTNSRSSAATHETWRRRECSECGSIFTTYEHPDYPSALRIEKADKALEPFSRDILFMSLIDALSHKKTAIRDAGGLCDTIIEQIAHEHLNGLLTSSQLTTTAHLVIKRFDMVAGSVYAAQHEL